MVAISIAWGFSPWRLQRYGYLFTNILSLANVIFAVILWFKAETGSDTFLLSVFGLEIFAFYFLAKRDQKISLIPYYSIPLVQVSFLSIIILNPIKDYFLLYLMGGILIDFLVGASERRTRESIGKTLIMIVSLVTLILVTRLNPERLTLPLLVFIYFTSQRFFPLGLTKGDNQSVKYSVGGRTALFVLASSSFGINLEPWILYTVSIGFTLFSVITFFLLEDNFKSWSLVKQTNEINLILINVLMWGALGKSSLLLIILFNLYYFMPLILSRIELKGSLSRIAHALSFLLINGVFIGAISNFFNNILKNSEFSHFGLDIFYLLISFWVLNIAFGLKFPNLRMQKRKIDHFHPLFLTSVIITSLIISF